VPRQVSRFILHSNFRDYIHYVPHTLENILCNSASLRRDSNRIRISSDSNITCGGGFPSERRSTTIVLRITPTRTRKLKTFGIETNFLFNNDHNLRLVVFGWIRRWCPQHNLLPHFNPNSNTNADLIGYEYKINSLNSDSNTFLLWNIASSW
jgi:hypothetical protein